MNEEVNSEQIIIIEDSNKNENKNELVNTNSQEYTPIKIKNEDIINFFNNFNSTFIIIIIYLIIKLSHSIKNYILDLFSPDGLLYVQKLTDYSNRLLITMDADRVTVGLFANGQKFLNNVGMKSMHIVTEVTSSGTQRLYEGKRIYSISSINMEIKECLKNKNLISYQSIDDKNISEDCKNYLIRCGVKSVCYILIKNVGFIAIYYNKRRKINYRQFLNLITKPDSIELISTIKNLAKYPHEFRIRNIISSFFGIKFYNNNIIDNHENIQLK